MRRSHVALVLRAALLPSLLAACADRGAAPAPTAPQLERRATDDASNPPQVGPSPVGAPEAVGVRLVASGLISPVHLVQPNGVERYRFIVDQVGVVRVLDAHDTLQPEAFLDLRSKIPTLNPRYDERGLLGLAFHRDFVRNGRFFVFYNAPPRTGAPAGYNNTVTVSEFRVAGDPRRLGADGPGAGGPVLADPNSERVVLQVDHPQSNHNGGGLAFGPDGNLYISIGDGGNANDVGLGHVEDWYAVNAGGNGQDITQNLLGNVLRLDVDHGAPYTIPHDNPFVGKPGLDEIYAYGFRNPYAMSFDMGGDHALLAMDAGQNLWEEVSQVVRGGDYGWNVKEGTHCFSTVNPNVSLATCPSVDPSTGAVLRDPVIEFANSANPLGGLSISIIGGYVYRGRRLHEFDGRYVFGGFSSSFTSADGRMFVATPQSRGLWTMHELLVNGTDRLGQAIKGFGQDARGEVYVLGSQSIGPSGTTGRVYKLVPAAGTRDDDDSRGDDR